MDIVTITDPTDPRIAGFRDIRERDLAGRQGLFVAEGTVLLTALTADESLCSATSVLVAAHRVKALMPLLERFGPAVTLYAAEQTVMNTVAGFDIHRGVLALGLQPPQLSLEDLLDQLGPRAVLVMACGIGNHDNMGAIFRNAAAFGADAVLLDDRCCSPFYRKAIRVSVGAVLRTPMAYLSDPVKAVDTLKEAGFQVLALSPSAEMKLADVDAAERVCLILGSEGPGLSRSILDRSDAVSIPMAPGFDSLNVATAGAIALHHVTR